MKPSAHHCDSDSTLTYVKLAITTRISACEPCSGIGNSLEAAMSVFIEFRNRISERKRCMGRRPLNFAVQSPEICGVQNSDRPLAGLSTLANGTTASIRNGSRKLGCTSGARCTYAKTAFPTLRPELDVYTGNGEGKSLEAISLLNSNHSGQQQCSPKVSRIV
jgi:hypothetical protein